MILKHWNYRAYAYLAVYLALVTLLSGAMLGFEFILLGLILVIILLYNVLKDEYLFYLYLFFALLMLPVSFMSRSSMNVEDIGLMYLIMAPFLMHIIEMHFGKFGTVHNNTYLVYMAALALSFLMVLMVLYLPKSLGIYAIITASLAAVVLYFLITLTPQDENEE